jgi:hypothetical protein
MHTIDNANAPLFQYENANGSGIPFVSQEKLVSSDGSGGSLWTFHTS